MSSRFDDRSHAELEALLSAHALRALDAAEAAQAEELIASSSEWRAAYEHALETTALLALVPRAVDPPPALRDRLLAAARAESQEAALDDPEPAAAPAEVQSLDAARERRGRREKLALRLFATAMAAAACVAALFAFMATQDANDLRDQTAASARVTEALATPGATVVPLEGPGGSGGATVILPPGSQPVLVSTLVSAPTAKTYELWAIPASGGAPVPIGTFEGGDDNVMEMPADALDGASTVAITVEPEGGSPAPTTAPFLSAGL